MAALIINQDEHSRAGISVVTDNGGNMFVAYTHNDRTANTTTVIVEKYAGTQLVTQREIVPDGGAKADSCAITIAGADLLVALTAHAGGGTAAYASSVQLESIRDFCVPYARGTVQQGGAVSGLPSSGGSGSGSGTGTGTGGTPVTDADVAKIVAAIKQEFGGNIRAGIQAKSRDGAVDALTSMGLASGSLQSRGLDQFLKDRVYEVLRDNGVIKQ